MAMEKGNLDRQESFTKSHISADKIYQMRLHYVRIHDVQDSLKLQADFGDKIVFNFNQGKQLDDDKVSGPFIYTLDLGLRKETNGELSAQYGDLWKPISRFNMQGTRGLSKLGSITYNEKHNEGHALIDYLENSHYFLLDVTFSSKLVSKFPGKTLLKQFTSIFDYSF